MHWIELSVQTDAEGAEAAAALLNEYIGGGAVIEETVTPDPGEIFDPARAFTVRAFFSPADGAMQTRALEGLWHLAQLRAMAAPQTRTVREEDWAEAWKKHYTIVHVGKRTVIKPSWLDYAGQPGEIIVELDPGMAFGTGLHPTTRTCLAELERFENTPRVLDVGTGSGILSIAAAKLGAREILALDTDAIAVETATRNIAHNHMEPVARVTRGSLEGVPNAPTYDLILINILAETIIQLAPALAARLKPGGQVIASGILDSKATAVAEALRAVGIETIDTAQAEDWVTLVGQRVGIG